MKPQLVRILRALTFVILLIPLLLSTKAHAGESSEVTTAIVREDPLEAPRAPTRLTVKPPMVGVTGSFAIPFVYGKPVSVAIGVQTIVPIGCMRLGIEAFVSTPVNSMTPAIGGDVALGCVNKAGTGGAIGVYYRHTLAHDFEDPALTDIVASNQAGPAVVFLNKPSKEAPVVLMMPLALWFTPSPDGGPPATLVTLSFKVFGGIPYKPREAK